MELRGKKAIFPGKRVEGRTSNPPKKRRDLKTVAKYFRGPAENKSAKHIRVTIKGASRGHRGGYAVASRTEGGGKVSTSKRKGGSDFSGGKSRTKRRDASNVPADKMASQGETSANKRIGGKTPRLNQVGQARCTGG